MSNAKYVIETFAKNENVYLYDDYQNVAIKMVPKGKKTICYAKLSNGIEYEVDERTNIVMDAYIGGKIITEKEYISNVRKSDRNSSKST